MWYSSVIQSVPFITVLSVFFMQFAIALDFIQSGYLAKWFLDVDFYALPTFIYIHIDFLLETS